MHKKGHEQSRHRLFGAVLMVGTAIVSIGALALPDAQAQSAGVTTAPQRQFNIAPQPLPSALTLFGQQSGLQVSVDAATVRTLTSPGASGAMTYQTALDRLLAGTGLSYRFTSASTVVIALPGSAGDAAATDGYIMLDTINVQGSAETATSPVVGYVANVSGAGTKTNTPIMQTPRSIEVVGKKELEQRAPATVADAVRYASGVTTGSYGYDPRFDQIFARGFDLTTYGNFKDGLRQMSSSYGAYRTDPYALERIDIVKGPAASLYGQSSPGGLVDQISKRPSATPIHEIMARVDSTGRYQTGFDYGGLLTQDETWLYRIVGLGRLGEGSFDVEDQRFMLAPSLTYAPDADTKLTILALAQHDVTDGNVAALNRNGKVYDIRASDPDYDTQKITQYQLGYEFEKSLSDTWTFRNNSRIGYVETEAKYLTGSVSGGGWKTDSNGNLYYARGPYAISDKMYTGQTDANVLGEFDTGPLSHKLLLGFDYQASSSEYLTGSEAASSQYNLYLNNPTYGRGGSTPAYTSGKDTDIWQAGLYAQDQIQFLDRWHLTLGARQDWTERQQTNHYTGATTGDKSDAAATYNAGLLYESELGLSPYISYATTFQPTSYVDSTGALLDPLTGKQVEIGLKYKPDGFNALFSIAAYYLKEQNLAKYAGYNSTAGSYYESIGEVTSKGIEAQARANISQGLDLIASYTFNDAEITNDITTSNIGNTPMVTPRHTASLWLDYAFQTPNLEGLQIGGGARYIGETYTSNANTAKNASAVLLDAAIRYDFGAKNPDLEGLMGAINVSNITDEKVTTCNNGYCYLGEGRILSATLTYRW